ncbi:uncharacterized protein LOC124545453 [Schistocerca americana]|uniref:uncharacterized protein LOC124545453 n=1 Tax=Schistocerca americana TaxID=7009 RepID=UPI001F50221D|nr:uncharacterized protein LOC124545453 [Schistocerca americana]
MAAHQGAFEDITSMSASVSDMDETVLFPLTPGAENHKQRFQPSVTSTQVDPGGDGDGGSDLDITLTQAASRLMDSASKIVGLTRSRELRTSTPKRKRGPEGDGNSGGGVSSSSDDRPDWQESTTVRAKRYRKREMRNQRRKLLKDMTQLLKVMVKEEEELSSSSDEHPDWIESPFERRRQPFKIGKQQSKDKKPVQPAVAAKFKTAENAKRTSVHKNVPEFDNYLGDNLFLDATPGTIPRKDAYTAEDKGETAQKANSPKTAHETTLSEEEAIQQMLDAATLEDDVSCSATCTYQTQRSRTPVNSLSSEKVKSVAIVDETLSSGDDIAQDLMNVARIHEAVDSEISSSRKDVSQNPNDATTDAELASHHLRHDVTLSEEEAIYELLNHTVVEEDQEEDLEEELVKRTVQSIQSPVKAESSSRDSTATEFQQPGTTGGFAKTCENLRKEDLQTVDVSSPSLLTNWGREAAASGMQFLHSHDHHLDMNNAEDRNKDSGIMKVEQRSHKEEKEAKMPKSLRENAPSPSFVECCEEEAVTREEQLVDNNKNAEQCTDETVYMAPTSTNSELKNDDVDTNSKSVNNTAVSSSSSSSYEELRAYMARIRRNQSVQPCLEKISPHHTASSLGIVNHMEYSDKQADPAGRAEVQECNMSPQKDVAQDSGEKDSLRVQVAVSEDKHFASAYLDAKKKRKKADSPSFHRQKKTNKDEKRRTSQTTLSQWFKDQKDAGSSKQPAKTEQHSKPVEVVQLSSPEDESVRLGPWSTREDSPEPVHFDVSLVKKVLQYDDKPYERKETVPEARVETQLSFWFGGVNVFFPCKPYKPQRAIMSTVAQSCRLGQFALLESPTGTGKTLALLCAALAWQKAEKAAIAQRLAAKVSEFDRQEELRWQAAANAAAAAAGHGAALFGPGGIFDIHLQNQQPSVQGGPGPRFTLQVDAGEGNGREEIPPWELDALQQEQLQSAGSSIKCPKIFYGTRTHMQIKHVVSELRKTAYRDVRMCVLASREQFCIHEAADDKQFQSKTELCRQLLEEESVKVNGAMGTGCSYCDNVGIIKTHDNLSRLGCPTPMDIEDLVDIGRKKNACPYFASRSLITTADLIICPYNYLLEPAVRDSMQLNLKGEIVILDEAHNIEDITREAGSASFNMLSVIKAKKDCSACAVNNPLYTPLAEFLNSFHTWFTSQTLGQRDDAGKETLILPGAKAIASLGLHKIDEQRIVQLKVQLSDIVEEIRQRREERKERRQRNNKKNPISFSPNTRQLLESVVRVLQFVYGENLKHLEDYDFVLTRDKHQRMPKGLNEADLRAGSLWQCNLDIWCHNSAVVFSELSSVVRSLLLSSGTLSPMHSFSSELGVSFTNSLRGQHIVDSSQVFVRSVSKGPRGNLLSSEYKHARNLNYQDDLGELLLGICQIVPQGVLCFFSSYRFMELITTRWQQTGLWEKISQYKRVFLEPRTSAELEPVITEYYECTAAGALMMAVMRGKISEGFDFADGRARAVVVVGIPYPSVKDPQVTLKQKYNNLHPQLQNGRQWYTTQAYRALNQALGRCIRHIGDWGAMILADHRFEKEKDHARISQWLLEQLGHYHSSRDLLENLHSFIKMRMSVQ